MGIRLPGLLVPFHVTQQPAELVAVDGVRVGFWEEKTPMKRELAAQRVGEAGGGEAGGRELSAVLTGLRLPVCLRLGGPPT